MIPKNPCANCIVRACCTLVCLEAQAYNRFKMTVQTIVMKYTGISFLVRLWKDQMYTIIFLLAAFMLNMIMYFCLIM